MSLSFRELKKTHDFELRWHSFELRPEGSPPIPPAYLARIHASRPRLMQTAREVYGVELNIGPFGINSRPALILGKFAEAQGHGEAFHEAALAAYWLEGRDLSDPAVLKELLVKVGSSADDYEQAMTEPAHREAVFADVETAHRYGLNGVPASILAGKYLISGAQPTEAFAEAIEEVGRREAASDQPAP